MLAVGAWGVYLIDILHGGLEGLTTTGHSLRAVLLIVCVPTAFYLHHRQRSGR